MMQEVIIYLISVAHIMSTRVIYSERDVLFGAILKELVTTHPVFALICIQQYHLSC